MDKQTVTDEETVSEQVRKEQIEAEGDTKKAPAGAASRSGGGRGQSSGRAVAPARQAGASKARRSRGIPRGGCDDCLKGVCATPLGYEAYGHEPPLATPLCLSTYVGPSPRGVCPAPIAIRSFTSWQQQT